MAWSEIPGWAAFTDLYADYLDHHARDGHTVVEVGVFMGRSIAFLAAGAIERRLKLNVWGVDPWIDAGHYLPAGHPYRDAIAPFGGSPYAAFCAHMAQFAPKELEYIHVHKRPSLEARKLFADKSCDLVLIDGEHSYEGCSADIAAWRTAIKDGGILAGDDYLPAFPGVVRAVKEAFGEEGVGFTVHGSTWIAGQYRFGASSPAPKPAPPTTTAFDGSPEGLEREYDLGSLPDLKEPVVLDIGANVGNFARIALRRWPGAMVHCFEPHPETFARLRENIVACKAYNVAVTHPARGRVRLYEGVNGSEECSLRDDVRWPHCSQRLDKWVDVDTADAASLPAADVVKVDTEGSEVEILSGLDLGRAKVLLVEAHAVKGDLRGQMEQIVAIAQKNGLGPIDVRGTVMRFVRDGQQSPRAAEPLDRWVEVETVGGTWRFGKVQGEMTPRGLTLNPSYHISPLRMLVAIPVPGHSMSASYIDMPDRQVWGYGGEETIMCSAVRRMSDTEAKALLDSLKNAR